MIQIFRSFLITFLSFLFLPVIYAQDITGDWYGKLQRSDSLRITLHISKDKKGLKATWDSPDIEFFNSPVAEISYKNNTLLIQIPRNYILFEGQVNEDYSTLSGDWSEFGNVTNIDFGRNKLLSILLVDSSSLKVLPARSTSIKAGHPRKIPYNGKEVITAGNPQIFKIDTSKITVLTPGKDSLSHPVFYKFPDPVKEKEYPYQSGNRQYSPVITRAIQPEPITATPMRMRDAASLSLQYLDVDKILSFQFIRTILEDSKGNIWFGSNDAGICRYDGKTLLNYTDKEGLPGIRFRGMIEDSIGNIWFGTDRGVCKYDGKNFILYSGGIFNNIWSSLVTRNGDLWFGTGNGAIVKRGDIWIKYTEDQGLTGNLVTSMAEDNEGNIWFGTNGGGISKFDGLTFTNFKKNDGLNSNGILSCIKDKDGNLWFGTDRGVCKYNGTSFLRYTTAQGLSGNVITTIAEDDYGNLWFGTEKNGINLFDGNTITHITQKEGLSSDEIRWITKDNTNNIWIGTRFGGLIKFRGGSFTYFTQFENISNGPVSGITEDRNGNIWFGISGLGMLKYDGESFFEMTEKEGLDDPYIRYFIFGDRDGNIWFSNDLGLHQYNGTSFIHYYDNFISDKQSINPLYGIYEDEEGILWLGSFGEGLKKTDREYIITLPRFTPSYVGPVLKDSRGDVWYGTATNGMIKYDGECIIKYSRNEGLSGSDINSLFEDEKSNLWIGVNGEGLNRFDGYTFTHYSEKEGLCNNNVTSIVGDINGNIWVGTNNGLSLLSPQGNSDYSITSFGIEDGLKSIQFNSNSVCLDSRKRLWWGTGNTVTMLDLNSFEMNPDPPVIQLNSVLVNQEYIDFGALLAEKEKEKKESADSTTGMKMRGMKFSDVSLFNNYPLDLKLPHHLNHLTFNFVATEWSAPYDIRYQYMLEGMDEEWSHLTTEAIADYRNISSGKYTFKVRAISKAGTWSETFEYLFMVKRPWWFQGWAIMVYTTLLILIARYYIRFIISRERIKAEVRIKQVEVDKMQELDQLKSKFFANISHEFRTPLTLILGPVEDLIKRGSSEVSVGKNILEAMQRNGKRLLQLINQLLDISKLETGKINLQVSKGNLEEFVRTIIHSFISLAESKQIRYEYDLPETYQIVYFDRDKLDKILTNLISNAFKYTPAEGEVVVNLRYVKTVESDTPQYAEINVIDTGIGIPDEMTERIFDRFYQAGDSKMHGMGGTGIGLALTKELLDLYRGEIHVDSEPGKGSTFSIKLPFLKEQFKDEEIVSVASDREETGSLVVGLGFETPEVQEIAAEEDYEPVKDEPVILIVEDNIDLRNYISRNLGRSYRIMVAENGKEGLNSAIGTIPDLVISDLMMPEMDGMEMCQKLKSDERTDHIPIILLTARADRGSKLEGLETGADDYIIKPFDAEELEVRIRNLFKQRKILKDKFRKEFIADATDQEVTYEDQILNKLMGILNNYISDSEFSIDQLADELHMSRRQVFRKVNALTGYSPNELIRTIRLTEAAKMFRSGHKHIAHVMHNVGFNNQSWFGKCFHELYGLTPSEYIKNKKV